MMRLFFGRIRRGPRNDATVKDERIWDKLASLGGVGRVSTSGKRISVETALRNSAVWSCARHTAELIASLPLHLYENQRTAGRVRVESDLSEILSIKPNSEQTAVEFWEGIIAHMLLRGNGQAERLYVGKTLVGLRPLVNATAVRNRDGAIEHRFLDRGKQEVLPAEKVFHLRGFGFGTGIGLSAVQYGADSMGLALSADEAAGAIFRNGLQVGGVIETEQGLEAEQRNMLQEMISKFVGSKNTGKILPLEYGLKFKQISMNAEDAQLLQTRRFNIEDVCRWFGTPPVIVGHAAEGQTMWGSGVEAVMRSWYATGINPLLTKIEARIRCDLVDTQNRRRVYAKYNREAMLQMDSKSKAEFLSRMVTSGVMTSDEARDLLELDRRGGAADELRAQTALAPLEALLGQNQSGGTTQ